MSNKYLCFISSFKKLFNLNYIFNASHIILKIIKLIIFMLIGFYANYIYGDKKSQKKFELSANKSIEIKEKFYDITSQEHYQDANTDVILSYQDKDITNTGKPEGVLIVDFNAKNNPFINDNNYKDNNTAMWNQEVFELFIGAKNNKCDKHSKCYSLNHIPYSYIELEVNKNGAIFLAKIDNLDGKSPGYALFLDPVANHITVSNIEQHIDKEDPKNNYWKARVEIPLSVINSANNTRNKCGKYVFNLFRVLSIKQHDHNTKWACTTDACKYLSWMPTNNTTSFHSPNAFAHLAINKK